jgi:regulator of replication initiation timing
MTDAESPPADPASDSPEGAPLAALIEPLPVSVYQLVEPLVAGRRVLNITTGEDGSGSAVLRHAGAADVVVCVPDGPGLPAPDAAVDVVLCGLSQVGSDAEQGAWMAEIRRVLQPDGFCVLRLSAAAFRGDAQGGAGVQAACTDLLLSFFGTVDIVEETHFSGVSFHIPGADDLAVNESLTRLSGAADHLVALCSDAAERPWTLSESLLVPTATGVQAEAADPAPDLVAAWQGEAARLEARCAELERERADEREGAMTLQDRADRLDRTVAVLRKEVERFLRQISDDAAARELLAIERDDLRRNLSEATQQAADAAREIEKRQIALRTLEKEVARLRAARGGTPT